jgi:hypothetical protein
MASVSQGGSIMIKGSARDSTALIFPFLLFELVFPEPDIHQLHLCWEFGVSD